jgi:hypothetical protein
MRVPLIILHLCRSNCVHGWTNGPDPWPNGTCWTVFPNPMAMGATFSPNLVLQAGQVTAEEGRALHNIALAINNGSSVEAAAINCFSPNVVRCAVGCTRSCLCECACVWWRCPCVSVCVRDCVCVCVVPCFCVRVWWRRDYVRAPTAVV